MWMYETTVVAFVNGRQEKGTFHKTNWINFINHYTPHHHLVITVFLIIVHSIKSETC